MILAPLLFLGSFLLYLVTLNGTIPAYRDSGDMINAVYTLGIAHPPGYPLYVLAAKLFSTLVSLGNAAYRVNVFSALCAAAATAMIYRSLVRGEQLAVSSKQDVSADRSLLTAHAICFLAAAAFAVTPAVLSLARVGEMYTFAALFGAGILCCSVIQMPRSLLLGSYLLGCGFGVHPTLIFLAPLLIPSRISRDLLYRLGFFLLGFSIVLFLYIRAHGGPLQNWGNPSSWEGLWRLISRSNYGGLKLHPTESQFAWSMVDAIHQLSYFGASLLKQWGWMAVPLGLLGAVHGRNWRLILSWLLAGPGFFLLSNLPLSQNTSGPILEPYWVLLNVIFAFWVAGGLAALLRICENLTLRLVLLAGFLIFPAAQLSASFVSFRQQFYAYDLARNMLHTMPSRAVMYDPDDQLSFTMRGQQLLEHRRDDIVLLNFFRTRWGYEQILHRWPDLLPPVPVDNAQQLEQLLWSYSIRQRPFFVDLPLKIPRPLAYNIEGILYQVLPIGQSASSDLARADQLSPLYVWRGNWRRTAHADFFTQQILNYRAAQRCNLGLKYADQKKWTAARALYREALALDPMLAAAYNDLGSADFEERHYAQAAQNYRLAMQYDPGNPAYRQNLDLTLSKTR